MIDNPQFLIPPLVATATAATPSPELPAGDEIALPAATVEQTQAADRVFSASAQHHPLATVLGVATSIMLLRDVAIDTFDTSGEDEEANEKAGKDENADSID